MLTGCSFKFRIQGEEKESAYSGLLPKQCNITAGENTRV
jgi:hypothetical protein